jgi:ATP-dependent Clp protease, protease subunit
MAFATCELLVVVRYPQLDSCMISLEGGNRVEQNGFHPPHERLPEAAYARLFEQRVVFLRGAIEDGVADDVAAQLLALDARSDEDITLVIDSPGGDVTGLFTIVDTMLSLRSAVHTRCVGMAASGAAVVLATGTGTRSATPNSRILLHQPHGGVSGQAKDIEIQAREIAYLRRRIEEILSERTGQPVEKIREDTDRDYWLTAEAAREYGVIDQVLTERAGLHLVR